LEREELMRVKDEEEEAFGKMRKNLKKGK